VATIPKCLFFHEVAAKFLIFAAEFLYKTMREPYDREIAVLRQMIEQSIGRRVTTPADFVFLRDIIATRCQDTLSDSTLKRIWGYVKGYGSTNATTLSLLARCVGFRDWQDFLQHYAIHGVTSHYVLNTTLYANDISKDASVLVTWQPDRRCRFLHLGEGFFRVTDSINSKLQIGDTFHCGCFIVGQPLYLYDFKHGDEPSSIFVVGKQGGLSEVKICKEAHQ
jgi:hypothetical protein